MIRLLIADDEALERETLADIVARRFEHEVTIETAENGRKAADTAVLWGADLILMDIEMPGMNGLDAARAVLEQRPECKVIFVTAYSLFQYAHEAMHLGACDYLLKPVNRTKWKLPSARPSVRSRRAAALQSWLRWNRSRKLTRRAMPPKQGRTTAMHWSWPMCASIWRITICSTSRWTV